MYIIKYQVSSAERIRFRFEKKMALKFAAFQTKVISVLSSGFVNKCQLALSYAASDKFLNFHTSSTHLYPDGWLKQNEWVYPPIKPGEPRRPAFVCHERLNIKYSPKNMWYIACLVRGLSVDEALKQLSFVYKKGALIAKEVIEEAQELAVKEHNIEFKSNLWVAQSFVGKGIVIKGLRRHAKMKIGIIHYRYCHYFVRLVEGTPPLHYYEHRRPLTGNEKLEEYFAELRARRIYRTL